MQKTMLLTVLVVVLAAGERAAIAQQNYNPELMRQMRMCLDQGSDSDACDTFEQMVKSMPQKPGYSGLSDADMRQLNYQNKMNEGSAATGRVTGGVYQHTSKCPGWPPKC